MSKQRYAEGKSSRTDLQDGFIVLAKNTVDGEEQLTIHEDPSTGFGSPILVWARSALCSPHVFENCEDAQESIRGANAMGGFRINPDPASVQVLRYRLETTVTLTLEAVGENLDNTADDDAPLPGIR